jgi:hypothetical protein
MARNLLNVQARRWILNLWSVSLRLPVLVAMIVRLCWLLLLLALGALSAYFYAKHSFTRQTKNNQQVYVEGLSNLFWLLW